MILSHSELDKLIKKGNLISGLSEKDKNDPTGCTFDLQLDKLYKLVGNAFIGINERQTPEYKEIASYSEKTKQTYPIKPGEYYMAKTIEEVNMPSNLVATVIPRTTLLRSGLSVITGVVDPGYKGSLHFGLKNEGNVDVVIEMGARFAVITFHEIKGKVKNLYKGKWQGGRATTKGREKQI